MKNPLQKGDALLVIDAQIDFFPGGALPVAHSDVILPVINQWIKAAEEKQIPILFSRDWHPANHCSFQEQGGPWPTHCVQHSRGARIHPKIHLPPDAVIINKADEPDREAYSDFTAKTDQGISLTSILKSHGVKRLWLNGLAQDYCVCETALEGRRQGYEVRLILKGTMPLTEQTGQEALKKMQAAGVIIEY